MLKGRFISYGVHGDHIPYRGRTGFTIQPTMEHYNYDTGHLQPSTYHPKPFNPAGHFFTLWSDCIDTIQGLAEAHPYAFVLVCGAVAVGGVLGCGKVFFWWKDYFYDVNAAERERINISGEDKRGKSGKSDDESSGRGDESSGSDDGSSSE